MRRFWANAALLHLNAASAAIVAIKAVVKVKRDQCCCCETNNKEF